MRKNIIVCIALGLMFLCSCNKNMPKPYGYFRIELPVPEYVSCDTLPMPCSIDVSKYTVIKERISKVENESWVNIVYPFLNGTIHCSYVPIQKNFRQLSEDSRNLVYKHSIRADAIIEHPFENKEKQVYGILYELTGNSASPLQFVVTDSVRHFLRGSLYFSSTPNADSIAPIAKYIEDDLRYLIETIQWK